ncbi:hypothetical protein ACFLQU_03860 [Verrucomicrobiota bacterium]
MGVGLAFVIPADASSTWQEMLGRAGIEVLECFDEIAESDRDFFLSAGTFRCPWGELRYDVQTCPLDVPLSNPEKIEHFVMRVFFSSGEEKKRIKETFGQIFQSY